MYVAASVCGTAWDAELIHDFIKHKFLIWTKAISNFLKTLFSNEFFDDSIYAHYLWAANSYSHEKEKS